MQDVYSMSMPEAGLQQEKASDFPNASANSLRLDVIFINEGKYYKQNILQERLLLLRI